MRREAAAGKQSGRTQEIQRLIRACPAGRVTDFSVMGERQIVLDCDVIQADGGTRTAAITGAFVALHKCFELMKRDQLIKSHSAQGPCRGDLVRRAQPWCSRPRLRGRPSAGTDANFVMTGKGHIVEVQGTAEGERC